MKYMDYELSYMERFHIYLNYKSYMNLQYFIYETAYDFIYEIFMYEIVMRNFHICNVPYTVATYEIFTNEIFIYEISDV